MKKINKKALLILLLIAGMVLLTGCQRNMDANGVTLPEKIIYLTTKWSDMMSEGFITVLLVYPLAQAINWVSSLLNSAVLGVIIITLLFNLITLPLSIKTTVQTQKLQQINPELQAIQEKYAGKDDDNSRMQQAQEMQKLYNKYGINPLGSMLTPFLQFPILIAMYYAVQRAAAVVNGTIFGIPLQTTPKASLANMATNWPIVVIFGLMIITQLLSSMVPKWLADASRKNAKGYKKYAEKNTSNATQNTMLYAMVLMVAFIGFSWPVTMSVYWLINSGINIAKTVFVQKRYVNG